MATLFHTVDLHYYFDYNCLDGDTRRVQAEVMIVNRLEYLRMTESLCAFWFRTEPAEGDEGQAPEHLQPATFMDGPLMDDPRPYRTWRFDRIETPSLSAGEALRLLGRTTAALAPVAVLEGATDDLEAFLTALTQAGIPRATPVDLWGEARIALISEQCAALSRAHEVQAHVVQPHVVEEGGIET